MPKRRGGEECVPFHCGSSDSERFIHPCEGPWFLSTTIARIVLEQMIAQRHRTAWTHPTLRWACVAMGPPGRLHGDALLVLAVSPTPSSAVCFVGSCVGLGWLGGCILASTRSLARPPPLRSAAHLRRVPEPTHAHPPRSCATCAPSIRTTCVHTTRLGALWFHPVVSPWDAHNPSSRKGGIGCGTPGSPSSQKGGHSAFPRWVPTPPKVSESTRICSAHLRLFFCGDGRMRARRKAQLRGVWIRVRRRKGVCAHETHRKRGLRRGLVRGEPTVRTGRRTKIARRMARKWRACEASSIGVEVEG